MYYAIFDVDFGKQNDLEDVAVKPLLMRKGTTRLALYGLGNIRDDRLNRIFENKKVLDLLLRLGHHV